MLPETTSAAAKPASPFDLTGRVALVTGAARGLGHACAVALAQAGCDMALGLRTKASGQELVESLRGLGRRVLPVQMDVMKLAEIRAAVSEAIAHFGRIDILVNNAGFGRGSPAEDMSEKDYDDVVQANLKGTFFVSQEVGRTMIKNGGGKIINMGSQAGTVALPGASVYCVTKAGIAHLTKCLAVEWGKHNINVNCVAPTYIHTPGTSGWGLDDFAERTDLLSRMPVGRLGEPIDVAGAVVFLASPAAEMITGATLLIDAGYTSL
jgi:NAD(P)-dependent dehydrogenase (short-subunit alcohol dehydrogenase family)